MGKTFRKPKAQKPVKVKRLNGVEADLVSGKIQVGGAGAHKDKRKVLKHKPRWED